MCKNNPYLSFKLCYIFPIALVLLYVFLFMNQVEAENYIDHIVPPDKRRGIGLQGPSLRRPATLILILDL